MTDGVETWRSIPDYDGYEASNLGRIRALDRTVLVKATERKSGKDGRRGHSVAPVCRRFPGGIREGCIGPLGYRVTNVGKGRVRCFHDLILRAFRGPPKPGQVARHLDDNKLNNRLENLIWGTQAENMADAVKNGGYDRQARRKCKLADVEVCILRHPHLGRLFPDRTWAAALGVTHGTVQNVRSRRTHVHVE